MFLLKYLLKLLKCELWPPKYSDLILMFQKELGEKIIAKFPSSKYGRLSILTNLMLDLKRNSLFHLIVLSQYQK